MGRLGSGAVYITPSSASHPYDVLRSTGIPCNGRTCMACWGLGQIMLIRWGETGPFYQRATMVNGQAWPSPDHIEPCRHCDGTGVMGPGGQPISAGALSRERRDG